MGIIAIDSTLQTTEATAELFSSVIVENRVKLPKTPIPQILVGKLRPGLDADVLAAAMISRFPEIGIPTGPLVNGSPNVFELLIKMICEEIVETIQTDMRIDAAVDIGMTVTSQGGNSGGPVLSIGQNAAPHTATGIPV